MKNEIEINRELCRLCGGCVSVCPVKVIIMHKDNLEIGEACIGCLKCVKFCPSGALSEKK